MDKFLELVAMLRKPNSVQMKSLKIPETIREDQLIPTTAQYSKCARAYRKF